MYKQDKIGVDGNIDGLLGELSHDIRLAKEHVAAMEAMYEEAMNAYIDARIERDKARNELKCLESIDEVLRRARTDVDQAYDDWLKLHKS